LHLSCVLIIFSNILSGQLASRFEMLES
jgi:hypothetical protein